MQTKLVGIKLMATMERGQYEEVVGEDNDLINSIVSTYQRFKEKVQPVEVPGVEMASSTEPREVYCEATKKNGCPL